MFKPGSLFILFGLFTGCAPQPAADTAEWQIHYRVSGGIAGLSRQLSLTQKGHYQLIDHKRQLNRTLIASPAQMARLSQQLEKIASLTHDAQLPSRPPLRPCADCITQAVEIDYKGGPYTYKSRPNMPRQAEYEVLLRTLSAMLRDGLAGP